MVNTTNAAAAAVLLLLAASAAAQCTLNTPLRTLAARSGRFFGGMLSTTLLHDERAMRLADRHFGITTAENECKMDATEPWPNYFTFGPCDAILNHARQHKMAFRGHALVWYAQVPTWMKNLQSPEAKRQAIVNHINGVMSHYRGKVYAWDVVNEAVDDSARGLRYSDWFPAVPDFIDVAFRTARHADPHAKLFYNDYGADGLSPKANYIYNMIRAMKQRGVPIDGIGFQMHVGTQWSPSEEDMRRNFQRFADLGLEIHITEADVACQNRQWDWGRQAQIYSNIARACMAVSRCKSLELWGVVDKYSWLNKPGVQPTGLIFDDNYNHKPAACAIEDVLMHAHHRHH
eukprot:m51a1_g8262 putative endo- -beta-xylanase (346) ;mRNA; r:17448-18703